MSWPGLHDSGSACKHCSAAPEPRSDSTMSFTFISISKSRKNIAAGMTRDEARYAAMRLFGNTTALKEETRDTWGWAWTEQFVRDLHYASRTLFRSPAFSILTILVITLGVGATTALFTVVRSVLLKPLPFKESERLIRLYEHSADDRFPFNDAAGGVFAEWKKQSNAFSDLAILAAGYEYGLSGSDGLRPASVGLLIGLAGGAAASQNITALLYGVQPLDATHGSGADQIRKEE
jgi:hypothetical protein